MAIVGAILLVIVTIAINVHVHRYSRDYILTNNAKSPFGNSSEVSVALVLGASVRSDGTLSPVLEDRAKSAIELYKTGKVEKLVVSGDNGQASYNEVVPMREYLMARGIPAENIFVDFAGFNTYDSMYRADYIFGAKNVIVVTQSFHLPRAIYTARHLGLNAYGMPADKREYYVKNDLREVLATVKTFFEVWLGANPKFLGPHIPIEGDGRESLAS